MRYRKKPVIIEAIEWNGFMTDEVKSFMGDVSEFINVNGSMRIATMEGIMLASIGDFIIKGIKGEYYPCKPDVFNLTYEEVNE